jgi:hypothetical protein
MGTFNARVGARRGDTSGRSHGHGAIRSPWGDVMVTVDGPGDLGIPGPVGTIPGRAVP